jgi:hypothetical protein
MNLLCAFCLAPDGHLRTTRRRRAVTLLRGTALCQEHLDIEAGFTHHDRGSLRDHLRDVDGVQRLRKVKS